MIPSILSSRFSNPSLLLLLFTFIPLCWPLLFFTFPLIFYFIVSDKFLLQPSSIHTNKNILRSMKLFQKCTAQRSRSKSTASTFSKGAPPSPLRPSITRNPMIVAHRAGGGSAPENTLAACRQTLSQTPPSTILHLDLHLTSDGEVICFHDQEPHERNMLKLTGVDKSVRHLNYSELPCLSPRIPTNPLCDLGTYVDTTQFDKKGGRTGEGRRICKFEEVCDAFLDTPMILELWDVSPLLALKTHNIIFNHRKSNHVIWGNKFSTEIQRNCEDLDAIIPTFNTATQWILIYVCYYLGALPFVPILHFDVFNAVLINERRYVDLVTGAVADNCKGVVTFIVRVTVRVANYFLKAPKMFAHLSARGIPVIGVNINDVEEWGYACQHNFAGIMTDYPGRLTAFLRGCATQGLARPIIESRNEVKF